MAAPDMSFWLGRKYALLQQQADANTKQSETQRIGTLAAARVDNTRANLMPVESRANVALTGAQTALAGEQTRWFGPEAMARIDQMDAGTENTRTNTTVTARERLTPVSQLFGSTPRLPGMTSVFSPSSSSAPRGGVMAGFRNLRAMLDPVAALDRENPWGG